MTAPDAPAPLPPASGTPPPPGKLIAMANQIAQFFRSYPPAEATAGITDHIEQFWTPRMRATIRSQAGHPALDPLAAAALKPPAHQADPHAQSPIRKETAGPDQGGLLASDAG